MRRSVSPRIENVEIDPLIAFDRTITPLRLIVAASAVLVAAFGVFDRHAQNFLGIGLGNDYFWDIDFVASDCATRADNKNFTKCFRFSWDYVYCAELIILKIVWEAQPAHLRFASSVCMLGEDGQRGGLKRQAVEASIAMPPLTYASYLDLEKLLTLQKPRSSPPEHDEMLFIIIHQTYELWFKQLLHEFEKIKERFFRRRSFRRDSTFKRVRTIMKVLVAQVDILETMTPSSFSSFRDRLETASGFQSVQFREIEFSLGYKRASTVKYLKPDFPDTIGSTAAA